jgi:hypothetical protein
VVHQPLSCGSHHLRTNHVKPSTRIADTTLAIPEIIINNNNNNTRCVFLLLLNMFDRYSINLFAAIQTAGIIGMKCNYNTNPIRERKIKNWMAHSKRKRSLFTAAKTKPSTPSNTKNGSR